MSVNNNTTILPPKMPMVDLPMYEHRWQCKQHHTAQLVVRLLQSHGLCLPLKCAKAGVFHMPDCIQTSMGFDQLLAPHFTELRISKPQQSQKQVPPYSGRKGQPALFLDLPES